MKSVEFDALRIVINKFQSVVAFIPTMSTALSPEVVLRETEAGGKLGDLYSYEIEGGDTKAEILQNLTEFQFSCVLFNGVMENACSEQGARMSAISKLWRKGKPYTTEKRIASSNSSYWSGGIIPSSS